METIFITLFELQITKIRGFIFLSYYSSQVHSVYHLFLFCFNN